MSHPSPCPVASSSRHPSLNPQPGASSLHFPTVVSNGPVSPSIPIRRLQEFPVLVLGQRQHKAESFDRTLVPFSLRFTALRTVQMDHLACFLGGMLVLGAEGNPRADEFLEVAKGVSALTSSFAASDYLLHGPHGIKHLSGNCE